MWSGRRYIVRDNIFDGTETNHIETRSKGKTQTSREKIYGSRWRRSYPCDVSIAGWRKTKEEVDKTIREKNCRLWKSTKGCCGNGCTISQRYSTSGREAIGGRQIYTRGMRLRTSYNSNGWQQRSRGTLGKVRCRHFGTAHVINTAGGANCCIHTSFEFKERNSDR